MDHIFISYSRKDEEQVNAFVERLRGFGFEVWQDVSGKRSGIPYSVKWFEVIEEAIYTAAGAIIFNTEDWERSKPCQRELQVIQEVDLPFLYVEVGRILANEQAVVDEAAGWCREQVFSEENSYCKWMRSGAYRRYKKLPAESYKPMGNHPFKNWIWTRKCYDIAADKNFHGPWTKDLYPFLGRAKRKFIMTIAISGLLGVIFLSMLIWAASVGDYTGMAADGSRLLLTGSEVVGEAWRVGEYDPVRAIWMIERCGAGLVGYAKSAEGGRVGIDMPQKGEEPVAYVGASNFIFMANRALADFVSRNYPAAFYGMVEECPINISEMAGNKTGSRYTVTLSEDTAQAFIYDEVQGITRQILLASVPETYCFSESGNELAIAAANKVYIYDLYGEAMPALLSYNFEDINELMMYGNKIYAFTEKGHTVAWDYPFQERKIVGPKISAGNLAQLADGRVMAVYIRDGSLVVNWDNEEKSFSLPFEGEIYEDYIAISPDYAYAAVSYKPEGNGDDRVVLIALSNGEIEKTYDAGCKISGFIFSGNGDSLIIMCYNKNKIARIDLDSGGIQESDGETYSNPRSIIAYEDQFLVCDAVGMLAAYDNTLRRTGEPWLIGRVSVKKQLAVSKKYDCILTAGRGGNVPSNNIWTNLSSKEKRIFLATENEPMTATTSVCVTNMGEYVAFGNAGGSIYLWDVGSMDRMMDVHSIPEAVINMLFAEDSSELYVLGSSGTVYTVDMEGIFVECIPEETSSIWLMNMRKAEEIKDNMYGLGLSMCE